MVCNPTLFWCLLSYRLSDLPVPTYLNWGTVTWPVCLAEFRLVAESRKNGLTGVPRLAIISDSLAITT